MKLLPYEEAKALLGKKVEVAPMALLWLRGKRTGIVDEVYVHPRTEVVMCSVVFQVFEDHSRATARIPVTSIVKVLPA